MTVAASRLRGTNRQMSSALTKASIKPAVIEPSSKKGAASTKMPEKAGGEDADNQRIVDAGAYGFVASRRQEETSSKAKTSGLNRLGPALCSASIRINYVSLYLRLLARSENQKPTCSDSNTV